MGVGVVKPEKKNMISPPQPQVEIYQLSPQPAASG